VHKTVSVGISPQIQAAPAEVN